ncbi:cytochrome C oxidase subunit IV family protein [Chloroflexota bacterium]
MDPGVGFVLWVVALVLMGGAVTGLVLALLFGKPISEGETPKEQAVAIERPAPEAVDEPAIAGRRAAYRKGIFVFLGLAVLTVLEFVVAAATGGGTALLFVLILAKAGLIVQYYMHIDHLWSKEGEH